MRGEKSQIQALDFTQPGLPLKRGRSQTLTHDYKRNGSATLFAALDAANGEVYGFCQEGHRHQESLKFLAPVGSGHAAASRLTPDRRQLRDINVNLHDALHWIAPYSCKLQHQERRTTYKEFTSSLHFFCRTCLRLSSNSL